MSQVIRRYELTDSEWERIQVYFPERQQGDKGRPRRESRGILNGILWVGRSGAAWRDLPERYGPWQTVYRRFREWSESGLIEKISHDLSEDADLQDISIDSTCQGTSVARTSSRGRRIAPPQGAYPANPQIRRATTSRHIRQAPVPREGALQASRRREKPFPKDKDL